MKNASGPVFAGVQLLQIGAADEIFDITPKVSLNACRRLIGGTRIHGPYEQTETNPAQPRERLEDAGECHIYVVSSASSSIIWCNFASNLNNDFASS
jgi:hypothetical protein